MRTLHFIPDAGQIANKGKERITPSEPSLELPRWCHSKLSSQGFCCHKSEDIVERPAARLVAHTVHDQKKHLYAMYLATPGWTV